MTFSKVASAQITGISAAPIEVETDTAQGLHSFVIVGLPDKAVEEARDRVGSAIKNAGFDSPKHHNRKVVVSLAPGDLKKEGPLFDLPIALSYLHATGACTFDPDRKMFVGELSLDGSLRPIRGALLIAQKAREMGYEELYLPAPNAQEAAHISGIAVYGVNTLAEVTQHLDPETEGERIAPAAPSTSAASTAENVPDVDFADIRGQFTAKRACEIAAAGEHNIALYGPPGSGKTMLAKALRGIMPSLATEEAIEVTSIHSLTGPSHAALVTMPPFRAPHHTSSYVAIAGGGTIPAPGEATLAHRGVLFLDEFPEFDRRVIETLRQPLEDGTISITRARGSDTFPARFVLVAAMNPCPCGNYGSNKECTCSAAALSRYQRKVSGPLVDRIDMWVWVPQIEHDEMSAKKRNDQTTSADIRHRVARARDMQKQRFAEHGIHTAKTNRDMRARDIDTFATLSDNARETLRMSAQQFDLSARSYHRVQKLARTIADLAGAEEIEQAHILEALQYRPNAR